MKKELTEKQLKNVNGGETIGEITKKERKNPFITAILHLIYDPNLKKKNRSLSTANNPDVGDDNSNE